MDQVGKPQKKSLWNRIFCIFAGFSWLSSFGFLIDSFPFFINQTSGMFFFKSHKMCLKMVGAHSTPL